MSDLPTWVQYLQALATPAIAVGGWFIARQQAYTAKRKLALDLFDRRVRVYERTLDAWKRLNAAMHDPDVASPRPELYDLAVQARFIFGRKVSTLISNLVDESTAYTVAIYSLRRMQVDTPEREAQAAKAEDLDKRVRSFRGQFEIACFNQMQFADDEPKDNFLEARLSALERLAKPGLLERSRRSVSRL